MDSPGLMVASSNGQRLPQKTSGLFNNGSTDVTDLVASVNELPLETMSNADVLTPIKDLDLSHQSLDLSDLQDPFDLDLDATSDFLENFTDLSNLFTGELMETAESVTESLSLTASTVADSDVFDCLVSTADPAPAVTSKGCKRKAEPSTSTPLPPDHSGYASSRSKRPRVTSTSTTSDVFSDDESLFEAVPGRSREEKYKERRRKNNIASRRSRETRKQKFVGMEEQAIELEASNTQLRARVAELEALAKEMKEILIQRMVQGK